MLCYYMHLRIDCSLRRLSHPSHRQISKERFQVQPQLLLRNIIKIIIKYQNLGWALWNRNSFEFKFDDTRLSSKYKNKIGPIEKKIVMSWRCRVSALLAVSAKRQQRQDITIFFFNGANLIFISWGKSGIIKFEFKTI